MTNLTRATVRVMLFLQRILWFIGGVLVYAYFKLLYRVRLYGRKNIPWRGGVLLIANHQSLYDPPMVGMLAWPRPCVLLARAGLFDNRWFGFLIRLLGAIPVRQDRADPGAMRTLVEQLNRGRPVVLFPEGQRSPNGVVQNLERGILLILKRTRVPVVPIAIEGAFDVWPRGAARPKWFGRIALRADEPIDYDTLMADGPDAALRHLQQRMEAMRLALREQSGTPTGGDAAQRVEND